MALTQYKTSEDGIESYEIKSPIYKWFGTYFDVFNYIRTSGAKKIQPFLIDDFQFLIVANYRDDRGKPVIKYALAVT